MTAVDIEAIEYVDIDEHLDNDHIHAHCTICWPVGHQGMKIALCGAIKKRGAPTDDAVPLDACVTCADLWSKPCRTCGS